MRPASDLIRGCAVPLLLALSAAVGLYGQGTGPRTADRILLAVDVTPNLMPLSSASTVLVTLSNQNPAANQSLQEGDSFTLNFDLGDGQIDSLPGAVITTSSTLSPAYFSHKSIAAAVLKRLRAATVLRLIKVLGNSLHSLIVALGLHRLEDLELRSLPLGLGREVHWANGEKQPGATGL